MPSKVFLSPVMKSGRNWGSVGVSPSVRHNMPHIAGTLTRGEWCESLLRPCNYQPFRKQGKRHFKIVFTCIFTPNTNQCLLFDQTETVDTFSFCSWTEIIYWSVLLLHNLDEETSKRGCRIKFNTSFTPGIKMGYISLYGIKILN